MKPAQLNRILVVAAVAGLLAFVKWASAIVVPMLLALLIAVVMLPVARSRRFPRSLGLVLALMVPPAAVVAMGWLFSIAIDDFFQELPAHVAAASRARTQVASWLAVHRLRPLAAVLLEIGSQDELGAMVAPLVSSGAELVGTASLVALVSGFLVVELQSIDDKLSMLPAAQLRTVRRMTSKLKRIQRYMLIKTGISIATGVVAAALCVAVGVPNALLLGLTAFLFNYVPTVGNLVAAVPAIALAALAGGPVTAGIVAIGYLLINLCFGTILETKLAGDAVGLSPLVVLVSIVFWGWVLGPVGAIVSVPLTLMVRVSLAASEQWRWLAVLLGTVREAHTERVSGPPSARTVRRAALRSNLGVSSTRASQPRAWPRLARR